MTYHLLRTILSALASMYLTIGRYICFSGTAFLKRRSRAALRSVSSPRACSMAATRLLSTRCGLIRCVMIPGSFLRMRPQREDLISCCVWPRLVELTKLSPARVGVAPMLESVPKVVRLGGVWGGEGLDMTMSYSRVVVIWGDTPECFIPRPFMHGGGG